MISHPARFGLQCHSIPLPSEEEIWKAVQGVYGQLLQLRGGMQGDDARETARAEDLRNRPATPEQQAAWEAFQRTVVRDTRVTESMLNIYQNGTKADFWTNGGPVHREGLRDFQEVNMDAKNEKLNHLTIDRGSVPSILEFLRQRVWPNN